MLIAIPTMLAPQLTTFGSPTSTSDKDNS